MSRQQLEHLLQECLEGFDAGLSPEECLSAYPHVRGELEPMLRQALSLRFAFAAAPSEEFKRRGRESLLFHAGRDVSRALSSEPDREFVMDARQRFLSAAGAQAQEALRDVPPPRLPFWVNARRHLLDAAANPAPRSTRQYAFAMRSAMSAAVIMLAVAVATLGFFLTSDPSGGPGTRNASANTIEYIEEQLDQIEKQKAKGIQTESSVLVELSNLTTSVVESGEVDESLLARLPALIERQNVLVSTGIATSSTTEPALIDAAQKLAQAESQVAAAVETPAPTTTTAAAIGPASTATPQPTASVAPTSTRTPATTTPGTTTPATPAPTPASLDPGQVLVRVDLNDKTYATTTNPLPWVRVTTSDLTFVIGSDWKITNITTDANGLAVIETGLNIDTFNSLVPAINVSLKTGEVLALINGEQVVLRSEKGVVIDSVKLLEMLPNRMAPILHHFVTSIEPAP